MSQREGHRETEEGEDEDHEEGEETRESSVTLHHTMSKNVSSGMPEGHTHTKRKDRRDSPSPPVSCSCPSVYRRLQSILTTYWWSLNIAVSNAHWIVEWNSFLPLNVFLQSSKVMAPPCDVRHYERHYAFTSHCCKHKAHLGIHALMLTEANY